MGSKEGPEEVDNRYDQIMRAMVKMARRP